MQNILFLILLLIKDSISDILYVEDCQVLIVGGTTSALAAALASAENKVETCMYSIYLILRFVGTY
jgi:ribulose 1,5-bisphosphate synthetase/thiazole synthase